VAEAKFQIVWTSDLRELKKSFAEVDKLTKKYDKGRDLFRKKEDRAHKDEMKRTKELFKFRENAHKSEEKYIKQQLQAHSQLQKVQSRMHQSTSAAQDRARKKDKEHIRDVDKAIKGSSLGKLAGFGKAAAGLGLGGLAGILIGATFRGYETHLGVQKALGGSIGLGFKGGIEGNASRARGGAFGYNIGEVAGMQPMAARATGIAGPSTTRAMMAASRATGMEGGEVGDIFGAIKQGGTSFAPTKKKGIFSLGVKEFEKMQASATFSGLEKARFPEFAQSMAQLIRSASSTAAGVVTGGSFAGLAALFGKLGGEGFRGSRGMEKLATFDQGVKRPGGGPEGDALIKQALGFGNPGSGVGFMAAERRQEKGLRDPNTFRDVMAYVQRMTGGNQDESSYTLKSAGLSNSMENGDVLQKIYQESLKGVDIQKALEEEMRKNKPIEEQALDAMKEAGTSLAEMAHKFDFSAAIGATVAPAMEKLESLQMELVTAIFDLIKEIKAWLGMDSTKNAVRGFLPGTSSSDIPTYSDSDIERLRRGQSPKKKTTAAKDYFASSETRPTGLGMERGTIETALGRDVGDKFYEWATTGKGKWYGDPAKVDAKYWPPELIPALQILVKNSAQLVDHSADAKNHRQKVKQSRQAAPNPGIPNRVTSSTAPHSAGRTATGE
jgi:hypothetical protein